MPPAARTNDDDAFAAVYARHVDIVYSFLARRIGSQLAEDLTAQTFVEAYEQRHRFDPSRGDRAAWLFGIATNLLRRHYRTEERMLRAIATLAMRAILDPGFDEDAVVGRVVADERWPAVAEALAAMPAGERDVLLLHTWADLSYTAIAAVLNIPVGTVRSRMNRARSRLVAALDPTTPTKGRQR